jgi:hypothetical protein
MPTFFVLGSGKAGSTSLWYYLKQHPEVYMSPLKEPDFFSFMGERPSFGGPRDAQLAARIITELEEYRSLFEGVSGETAIGEASQSYLRGPETPYRIQHYIPNAKFIALLRNPADRAYSAYLQAVREGWEWLDFGDALREERARVRANWHDQWRYREGGFYLVPLKRYYELFGQDRIRVYLYEDLNRDPVAMLQSIFRFLGVDNSYLADTSRRHNVAGVPKSRRLNTLVNRPNAIKSVLKPLLPQGLRERIVANLRRHLGEPPPMPEEARLELADAYREDILKLQELIGRDLSAWLGEDHPSRSSPRPP